MGARSTNIKTEISAIKVNQWLQSWNDVRYDIEFKSKPLPYFYLFSIPAVQLKALSGIYRRSISDGASRIDDIGIQRRHNPERSKAIREYVKYGSPYSELNKSQKNSESFNDLKMPGWLPTAIVVNIIKPNERRRKQFLRPDDAISIEEQGDSNVKIRMPKNFNDLGWTPQELRPIEVIDGQHRLWAFESDLEDNQYELPVVAFYGLDRSWQAYIFWMINIKPKRINKSLAFDLYPLLRTEKWLAEDEGISVYYETRAQELTESLWSYQKSPWYHRIDMLGDSGKKGILSQAGWIRSLIETFIKNSKGKRKEIGGLYGSNIDNNDVLPWDRVQQAAFIIFLGQKLEEKIASSRYPWAESIRSLEDEKINEEIELDHAFTSKYSLLNIDIGNRAFLGITNDIFSVKSSDLDLASWVDDENDEVINTDDEIDPDSPTEERNLDRTITSLEKHKKIIGFVDEFTTQLAKYDWRTAATPNLDPKQILLKSSFRGGPGYKSMRKDLLLHLITQPGSVGEGAKKVNSITEEFPHLEDA